MDPHSALSLSVDVSLSIESHMWHDCLCNWHDNQCFCDEQPNEWTTPSYGLRYSKFALATTFTPKQAKTRYDLTGESSARTAVGL